MSKLIIIAAFLVLVANHSLAQELLWSESYRDSVGGDYLRIAEAPDGGFVVVGETTLDRTAVAMHGYLMRTDDHGKLLSDAVLHASLGSGPRFIVPRGDNGYFIVGPGAGYRVGVATVGATGQVISNATTPDNHDTCLFGSARATIDGGFVVARSSLSFPFAALSVGSVMKFDRHGGVQWHRKFYSSQFYLARSVRELSDGNIVVVGVGRDPRGTLGVSIILLSERGDSIWSTLITTEHSDDASDVVERSDGGLLVAGFSRRNLGSLTVGAITLRGANEEVRPMLVWLNRATGAEERRLTYAFEGQPRQIERAIGGGYLIASRWGGPDVVKVDDNGVVVWQHRSVHFSQGELQHFLPLADGRIVFVSSRDYSCMRLTMLRDTTAIDGVRMEDVADSIRSIPTTEFSVERIDALSFWSHALFYVTDHAGNRYCVVVPRLRLDSLTADSMGMVRIVPGGLYDLTIRMTDTMPRLYERNEVRSIVTINGALFWDVDRIVTPFYVTDDIVDLYCSKDAVRDDE